MEVISQHLKDTLSPTRLSATVARQNTPKRVVNPGKVFATPKPRNGKVKVYEGLAAIDYCLRNGMLDKANEVFYNLVVAKEVSKG